MENIENVDTGKICHYPWTHIGLGWDKFNVCCVSSPDDFFGEIMGGGGSTLEKFLTTKVILV